MKVRQRKREKEKARLKDTQIVVYAKISVRDQIKERSLTKLTKATKREISDKA